jgi:hypothetical protein
MNQAHRSDPFPPFNEKIVKFADMVNRQSSIEGEILIYRQGNKVEARLKKMYRSNGIEIE